MRFVWDPGKDDINKRKHGLSLAAGVAIIQLPEQFRLTYPDPYHDAEDDRWVSIGLVARGILFVVHAEETGDLIRIISVRPATTPERRAYFAHLEANTP